MTDVAVGGAPIDHELADLYQLVISSYTQRNLDAMKEATRRLLEALAKTTGPLSESRVATGAVFGNMIRYMIVATADEQLRDRFEQVSRSLTPEGRVTAEMDLEIRARSEILADLAKGPEGISLNDIVRQRRGPVPHIRAVVNHLARWGLLSLSNGLVRPVNPQAAEASRDPQFVVQNKSDLIPPLAQDPLRRTVELDGEQSAYMDWLGSHLDRNIYPDVRGEANYLSLYALRKLRWCLADRGARTRTFWCELVRLHEGYVGREIAFTAILTEWEFAVARQLGEAPRLTERAGWRDPAWLVSEHPGSDRLDVDWVLWPGGLTSVGRILIDSVEASLEDILGSLHDQLGMTHIHYLAGVLGGKPVPNDSDLIGIEAALSVSIPRDDIVKACEMSFRADARRLARSLEMFPNGRPSALREVLPGVSSEVLPVSDVGTEWPGKAATRERYDAGHPSLKRVNREVSAALLRRAENAARVSSGVPGIGGRWVSELQVFQFVRASFPQFQVIHQARLSWLGRQSLDVYIPKMRVAIEFQGIQHDEPVDFFGGAAAFVESQERDARKRRLCSENGVQLVEIREGYDADELLRKLSDAAGRAAID